MSTPTYAILLKVFSILAFSIMASLIKFATSSGIPVAQIMFARNFFALILLLGVLAWQRDFSQLKTTRPGGHAIRALVGGTGMACSFYTLSVMPLAQATVISFTAPLITVIFSVFLLGEVVRLYRWTAVAVGLVGVFVMLFPALNQAQEAGEITLGWTAFGVAIAAAIFVSLAKIQVRKLTKTEHNVAIVFYFALVMTCITAMTAPFGWVMPDFTQAFLMVAVGIIGGIAQLLLTKSFQLAEASALAPFDYTALLWAILIDIAVFTIYPSIYVIMGAAIVTASGMFVIYREHQLRLDRRDRAARNSLGV